MNASRSEHALDHGRGREDERDDVQLLLGRADLEQGVDHVGLLECRCPGSERARRTTALQRDRADVIDAESGPFSGCRTMRSIILVLISRRLLARGLARRRGACVPTDGGAVEASWVLRTFDGRAISSCRCSDPEISRVRLVVADVEPDGTPGAGRLCGEVGLRVFLCPPERGDRLLRPPGPLRHLGRTAGRCGRDPGGRAALRRGGPGAGTDLARRGVRAAHPARRDRDRIGVRGGLQRRTEQPSLHSRIRRKKMWRIAHTVAAGLHDHDPGRCGLRHRGGGRLRVPRWPGTWPTWTTGAG